MALRRVLKLIYPRIQHIRPIHISRCCYTEEQVIHNEDNDDHTGPEHRTPVTLYEHKVTKGDLKKDELQEIILGKLLELHSKLEKYEPVPPPTKSLFSKLFGSQQPKTQREKYAAKKFSQAAPNGMYLYGSVGCGKTMLMDILHDTAHITKKQRVHFHEFMMDVHKRIHEVKKTIPRQYNVGKTEPYDPIPPVAKDISNETWLICFDEFQVTDIADAMILKRLFQQLWKYGVIIIATSNRPPEDLYKNGLQRINFLPFIPMVQENCDVYNLDSGIDYRRQGLPAQGKLYFITSQCNAKHEMDTVYEELVSQIKDNKDEGPRTLTILNRDVTFQRTCARLIDCTFSEICMRPLGAADYLEICKHFDTVMIRDVPQLTLEKRGEARRFITLIDTLYDHRVRVVMSAEVEVDELFAHGELSNMEKHHARVLIGDLDIQKGSENESASLFTGEEELFAFERVMSRLTEIQTSDYWKQREILKKSREKAKQKKAKALASSS